MQKLSNRLHIRTTHSKRRLAAGGLAVAFILSLSAALVVPRIYADNVVDLQNQIEQLQAEAAQDKSALDSLILQAQSYQDAINTLQSQITVLQQNISINQTRQNDLQKQITEKQKQLDAERLVLGDDIKAMYVEDQLSAIEMLATSKSINDFVDSATYREAVQRNIQTTLQEIAKLQNQLQAQKLEVDQLLAAQRTQQQQLAATQAQQSALLAYNSTQQADFNNKIKSSQDKISDLQARQAALNLQGASRVSISGDERGGACDNGSGNGGYPLASSAAGNACDAPKDSIVDWAGIENRECTSYAYWYFKRVVGNTDFTASGDAKYWVATSNYPVHTWPQVGAIGVKTEGQWGHVTIVQAVGPSSFKGVNVPAGQVLTSEMNSDLTGKFSYNLRGIGSMSYIYK